MDYFNMEVMKYWSFSSTIPVDIQRQKIELLISKGNRVYSLKTDGNFSRAVITKERSALQTRGISVTTKTYGEVQDKVFWWDNVVKAFKDDTVLLGEIFLPHGIDKNVGSILRCKENKAKSIQNKEYYQNISSKIKFTAKDKRDIENNSFFNTPLYWRIFDVLVYEGENLMDKGIEIRSQYIEKAVKRINSPLVKGVKYFEADENFFDNLGKIFEQGGEGVVLYEKGIPYIPGKRGPSAYNTIKIKQTLSNEVDCFITGVEEATKDYTGKEIEKWKFWENLKTGEKLYGEYYSEYRLGEQNIIPITKNYYHGWCGAIICSVYDNNGNIYPLCKVAGLTEEVKEDIKNNFDKNWFMRPLTISGMMISKQNEGYSIRHPVIKSWRDQDIDVKDCTLSKIISQS